MEFRDTLIQNPIINQKLEKQKSEKKIEKEISLEEDRILLMQEIYKIFFKNCLDLDLITYQQLIYIEVQHLIVSYALGIPVGTTKILSSQLY